MKFSGKIEDGTSNKPLNFSSDPGLGGGMRPPSALLVFFVSLFALPNWPKCR